MSVLIACGIAIAAIIGLRSTAGEPPTVPAADRQVAPGIWIGGEELMLRPTSGPEWERLIRDASRDPGKADISDQDSRHDVFTLAAALVCVRTGERCAKARRGVVEAIGTEEGGRWLAVGRNLGAYVVAADLLGLRADGTPGSAGTRVQEWIEGWLSRSLRDNNDPHPRPMVPFHAGANAAAQEGFAYVAVAAYLGDRAALDRAWEAFRAFTCDPDASDREDINLRRAVRDGWAHDDAAPCAIAPSGTVVAAAAESRGAPGVGARRLDGALIADMRRGGPPRWPPAYTPYPWIGLEGLVPAALVLDRAGYPAFEIGDRAVLRSVEYLWYLRAETDDVRWFDGERANEVVHLVNHEYGTSYPVVGPTGRGRTVGYTGWTHPIR